MIRGSAERREVRELVGRYHVKASSERAPLSTLSGGNQQKVILGRWMCRDPKVLLLAELTQGIDVGARGGDLAAGQERGAGRRDGPGEELPLVCDRVFVLNEGRIVGELSGSNLTEDNIDGLALVGEENAA